MSKQKSDGDQTKYFGDEWVFSHLSIFTPNCQKMTDIKKPVATERPPPLGGGPLGLGDPNDRRLRKTERDVVIPKMIVAEAEKKCSEQFQVFLDCAKEAGLLVSLKCKKENNIRNECISKWMKNPELVEEVTNKYIDARSHYRRTGEPLNKYERVVRSSGMRMH